MVKTALPKMLELAIKNIKTITVTVLHMFKKVKLEFERSDKDYSV